MEFILADGLSMSDEVTVAMPMGVSGAFIRGFDESRLPALCNRSLEFSGLTARKKRIEEGLRNCNDPVWLARFAERRGSRNFKADLIRRASDLQSELATVLPKWETLRRELEQSDPDIPRTIEAQSVASRKRVGPSATQRATRHGSLVGKRMRIIKKCQNQPHLQICRELDDALQDGRGAIPIPRSWARDFGVKSYASAYCDPRCRPRVHRLISGSKP